LQIFAFEEDLRSRHLIDSAGGYDGSPVRLPAQAFPRRRDAVKHLAPGVMFICQHESVNSRAYSGGSLRGNFSSAMAAL
jgi:hypothetical protein